MPTNHTALISVTDKTGIVEFARGLRQLGFMLLSTGGTANLLRDHDICVTEVADYTESPEILDGRVKTLHPKIHAGVLADRSDPTHTSQLKSANMRSIDLVVVNLYDFANDALGQRLPIEKAVQFIDIGGPSLLRGAAKNHQSCLPVIDPADYPEVLRHWNSGGFSDAFRRRMAAKVFRQTARYDAMIAHYFEPKEATHTTDQLLQDASKEKQWMNAVPKEVSVAQALRYGENAHQQAALLIDSTKPRSGLAAAIFMQGKELSYNNYCDLDAAAGIVADLDPMPALTIIKHTNPCGTAASASMTVRELFQAALGCDPKCAFGGIIASNQLIDGDAARAMSEIFLECIIAPNFTDEALAVLSGKKNLRVLRSDAVISSGDKSKNALQLRSIHGGILVQTADQIIDDVSTWNCATKIKPTPSILADLQFAMRVCKHVKSNAIVLASGLRTIGVGAGQMSRVDSARLAVEKAREVGLVVKGSVLASDAFFPFRDSVDYAAKSGIAAIVQPGGSLRDQESIDAANEHGIVMMISGTRHFRH
jgi:phosphoribosylaminoimidazolecarboxamide formyltransferase/IMP cyclohydrolase